MLKKLFVVYISEIQIYFFGVNSSILSQGGLLVNEAEQSLYLANRAPQTPVHLSLRQAVGSIQFLCGGHLNAHDSDIISGIP